MENKLPKLSYLKARLCYDPTTGNLTWLKYPGKQTIHGDRATYQHRLGYLCIAIDGQDYYAHRIAYCMFTGAAPGLLQIDHKNRDRADNEISNLRIATVTQNQRNASVRLDNSSGVAGVHQLSSGKWQAKIGLDGIQKNLGSYYTKRDAIKARQTAEAKLWQI